MNYETINGMEYLTLKGMQAGAVKAGECAKIIRQWLPIKGVKKALAATNTMDNWFSKLGYGCIEFFKLHSKPGCFATSGPESSGLLWRELCEAMESLRTHYDLQDVDGDNRIPHSDVRGGQVLKPIDGSLLDRIEHAANGLLGLCDQLDPPEPIDPWILVKVGDMNKGARQNAWRHCDQGKNHIRHVSRGHYEILKSRLTEYVPPSVAKHYFQ